MRLSPRSLHGRMLALSLIATLAALVVAGFAIAGVLERVVTRNLDQRLDAELSLLATAVTADGQVDRARIAAVRGLLDPGRRWRWRIVAPGGTVGSRDFPTLDPIPPGPRERAHNRPRSAEGRWRDEDDRVHARQSTLATSNGPVTLSATAPRSVVSRPIRAALVPLLSTLAILGILLAGASLVQLRLGLRPVRALRDSVAAIRAGQASSVPEHQPDELRPLATELNALAADNAAALATARASAANLAHGLKTPIATLGLALAEAGRDPDGSLAAQVARIDATIRHHLARARSGTADTRAATPVAPALDDLANAIRRIHAARAVTITIDAAPALAVAMDPHDLTELAGNLIDNAARHAHGIVTVAARAEGRGIRLTVIDDGPGISAADRTPATASGVRLDESGDGHGFGLAIARDLAALYGGALALDEAPGGGLIATVTLPAATMDA